MLFVGVELLAIEGSLLHDSECKAVLEAEEVRLILSVELLYLLMKIHHLGFIEDISRLSTREAHEFSF
jgi:hypothetical protein